MLERKILGQRPTERAKWSNGGQLGAFGQLIVKIPLQGGNFYSRIKYFFVTPRPVATSNPPRTISRKMV